MDPITQNYNQESQKEMSHIEAVGQAFQTRCDQLPLKLNKKLPHWTTKIQILKTKKTI